MNARSGAPRNSLRQRLADGPHRLRPIHLGLVEIAASTALVLVAFLVRF